MIELSSVNQKVYIQENFLSLDEVRFYLNKAKKFPDEKRSCYNENNPMWKDRNVTITDDPIVKKVKFFLNKRFNLNLQIEQAEIQNWIEGSYSQLHIHNGNGRDTTKYNSLIYLNNNFEGGVFFTSNGIVVKPEPGLLTFFDGSQVYHGLSQVKNNDRYTLIFWWKK